MKASWTSRAPSRSGHAATQAVGSRRPTSSAWEGPERATTRHTSPVASRRTWLMRRFVSRSMPLETVTSTIPGRRYGAIRFPVSRTAKEGLAQTTSSAPSRQPKSPVTARLSGRGTPFSRGFSLVRAISSALAGVRDQRVTPCPLSNSTSARAVPQPPLPNTTVFMRCPPFYDEAKTCSRSPPAAA